MCLKVSEERPKKKVVCLAPGNYKKKIASEKKTLLSHNFYYNLFIVIPVWLHVLKKYLKGQCRYFDQGVQR